MFGGPVCLFVMASFIILGLEALISILWTNKAYLRVWHGDSHQLIPLKVHFVVDTSTFTTDEWCVYQSYSYNYSRVANLLQQTSDSKTVPL